MVCKLDGAKTLFYDSETKKTILRVYGYNNKDCFCEIDGNGKTYKKIKAVPKELTYSETEDGFEYHSLKKMNKAKTMIASRYRKDYVDNCLKIFSVEHHTSKIKEFDEPIDDFYWVDENIIMILFRIERPEAHIIFFDTATNEQMRLKGSFGIRNMFDYGEYVVESLRCPPNFIGYRKSLIILKNKCGDAILTSNHCGKTYKIDDYFVITSGGDFLPPDMKFQSIT